MTRLAHPGYGLPNGDQFNAATTAADRSSDAADAEMLLRRLANRHACPDRENGCGRPEHSRDVAALRVALDVVGLLNQPSDRVPAGFKECLTCRDVKPLEEFRSNKYARRSYCRTCEDTQEAAS